MEESGRIVRHENIWTTIQCYKCSDCFKLLRGRVHWQLPCPYCSNLIELPKHELESMAAAKEE